MTCIERETMSTTKKTTDWMFVVYEDSAPEDWREELNGIPCAISPLHDEDTWTKADERKNPEHIAGKPKKAHRHVLMKFDSNKTFNQIKEMIQDITTLDPKPVKSPYSMYRYLSHTDNPKKAQYDPDEVELLGGYIPPVKPEVEHKLTRKERLIISKEIYHICKDYVMTNLISLSDYVDEFGTGDEGLDYWDVLTSRATYFEKIVKEIKERVFRNPERMGKIYGKSLRRYYQAHPDLDLEEHLERKRKDLETDGEVADDFVNAARLSFFADDRTTKPHQKERNS